ncbi:hypothetical protein [Xanthomonas sacchari]|uniref:hypothetical protein n=1 Tax=Xanthomonas sacchari TaxID=56458 RepID=UPI00225E1BCC|nr:hypothetical protein [Xanthomonas sacchari]MCW0435523.1 hypothetical protein [Xanthomonas sacchari]
MLRFRTPNGEIAIAKRLEVSDDGTFINVTLNSNDFEGEVKILRPFRIANIKKYRLIYLATANSKEDAVVDLVDKDSDDRFGIIIPIQALCSSEHSRAQDDYFEYVASAVIPVVAEDLAGFSKIVDWRAGEVYTLADFFSESMAVLAIRDDKAQEFPPEKYLVSLFAHGYCAFQNKDLCSFISCFSHSRRKAIKLIGVDDSYLSNGYILSLYRDILPFERSDLAFFVLLYQIFESLMQHVFEERLAEYKIKVGNFNGSASDLRELSAELNDVTSERDRINACLTRSRFKQSNAPEITKKLLCFLKSASKNPRSEAFPDLLYDVRNLIFHSHRAIPSASLAMVAEINEGISVVMPKILALRS